jgi:anaerobic selenocysteine-containing dehydrogenase
MAFRASAMASVAMHAAASIAAVTGCWQYEGGGAFHSNSGIFKLNQDVLEGTKMRDPNIRISIIRSIGRC